MTKALDSKPTLALGLWVALVALIVDQGHKLWTIHVFDIGARGRVTLTPFLDMIFVVNPGISYGLFEQSSMTGQWLLSGFAVIVAIALALWLRHQTSRLRAIAIGLLIGGALGNAIDRPIYGGVADFFSAHAFGFYWYVFNLADAFIVAGVAALLYDSVFENRKKAAKTA